MASISARGNASAALAYYGHLQKHDYYTRVREAPGRWAGAGAARLSLQGPVTRSEFSAALQGRDPKTGDLLARQGGRRPSHAAGWDMTFSAPKSVSVLWALSDAPERGQIEQAQHTAVAAAATYLETAAAWARRGRGGSSREPTAGLLLAQFDHQTSRDGDPQLHTHCFVFNLAPRQDGSWGAIVSRELYRAQKAAGAVYRRQLGHELERLGYRLDRQKSGFRVAVIPYRIERAFSKRRQAIEEAARVYGYRTPAGMEHAALRTRRSKVATRPDLLFQAWQAEARALGFTLSHERQLGAGGRRAYSGHAGAESPRDLLPHSRPGPVKAVEPIAHTAAALGRQLGQALQSLKGSAAMPGLKPRLHNRDREHD